MQPTFGGELNFTFSRQGQTARLNAVQSFIYTYQDIVLINSKFNSNFGGLFKK